MLHNRKNSKFIPIQMAHNVLAVCDVFCARLRNCEAIPAHKKCGGEKTHKGRKPDCVFL